jgi:hypothetical protein
MPVAAVKAPIQVDHTQVSNYEMKRSPQLLLCIHEVGHAVAHLVLDELGPYPGPHIKYITVGAESGAVFVDRRVNTNFGTRAQMEARSPAMPDFPFQCARMDIIKSMAGPFAYFYQREGPGPAFISDSGIVERILADDDLDRDGDLFYIRKVAEWLEPDDPRAELEHLWNTTGTILAAEWPGIRRVAQVLRARGDMDGDEFEAEWRAVRPTPNMRRRLGARQGLGGWREQFMAGEAWRAVT